MRKTIITDILLMYITLLLYTLPLTNIYNSIKTTNIEHLLINTLYITALTINLILTGEKTWNTRITTANILLTISLSLAIIPLGLTPTNEDLLTKIVTYSFPTLYSIIVISYNLRNNMTIVRMVKKWNLTP